MFPVATWPQVTLFHNTTTLAIVSHDSFLLASVFVPESSASRRTVHGEEENPCVLQPSIYRVA